MNHKLQPRGGHYIELSPNHRICHCGKCRITCNKHGKISKCNDCGKKRILGTITKNSITRHICNECIIKIQEKIESDLNSELNSFLRICKDSEFDERNEICIPETDECKNAE
jgi:hypothetical protein